LPAVAMRLVGTGGICDCGCDGAVGFALAAVELALSPAELSAETT